MLSGFGLQLHNHAAYRSVPNRLTYQNQSPEMLQTLEKRCVILWEEISHDFGLLLAEDKRLKNPPIAYEKTESNHDRWVLFLNGETRLLSNAELQVRLAESNYDRSMERALPSNAALPPQPETIATRPSDSDDILERARKQFAERNRARGEFTPPSPVLFGKKIPGIVAGQTKNREYWYVNFTSDGRWLVTNLDDGIVRFWDLSKENPLKEPFVLKEPSPAKVMNGHYESYPLIGNRVVVSLKNGTVSSWELSGEPNQWVRTELKGHDGPLVAADISQDGDAILTSGTDKTVRFWKFLDNGQITSDLIGTVPEPARFIWFQGTDFCVAGNVSNLVLDGPLRCWSLGKRTGKNSAFSLKLPHFKSVSHSPDGRWFAGSDISGRIAMWDFHSSDIAASRKILGDGHSWQSVTFGPQGDLIGLCKCLGVTRWSLDDSGSTWQEQSLQSHGLSNSAMTFVPPVAYDPNGNWVVVPSIRNALRVLNPGAAEDDAGESMAILTGHINTVRSISFSGDFATMASIDMHGMINIYRTERFPLRDAKPVFFGCAQVGSTGNMLLSPCGKWIVSGNWLNASFLSRPGDQEEAEGIVLWKLNGDLQPTPFD
jgi:WD40 repeat protein